MRHCLFILLLAVILYGCDPRYSCYVRNDSSSVLYVKTHPSIESLFDKESTYYDSVLTYKVNQEDKLSVYRVPPHKAFHIYGHIGLHPFLQEVPFDYLEIIQEKDTLVLDSKEKMLERLQQEGKTRKYFMQK